MKAYSTTLLFSLFATSLLLLPADAKKKGPKSSGNDDQQQQDESGGSGGTTCELTVALSSTDTSSYTLSGQCSDSCPISPGNSVINYKNIADSLNISLPTSVNNALNSGNVSYVECQNPDGSMYATTQTGGGSGSGSAGNTLRTSAAWVMGIVAVAAAVAIV